MFKQIYAVIVFGLLWVSTPLSAQEHWLRGMVEAAKGLSYKGAFLYARGDAIQVMKVHQVVVDGERTEKIWPVNGQPMEIVRQGDLLTCIHPDESEASLDHAIPAGPFAQIFEQQLIQTGQAYSTELLAMDRVAERKTELLMLIPDNQDRYSYRIWIDQETGLLLRSEIIDLDMNVLEQFQFVDFNLIKEADAELDQPVLNLTSNSHVETLSHRRTEVAGNLTRKYQPQVPESFRLMDYVHSDEGTGMMSFSDGMASFSLFWEPSEMNMPETSYQMGATTIITVKKGLQTLTIIGEIPIITAKQILQTIKL